MNEFEEQKKYQKRSCRRNGHYYGYPSCCIREFLKDIDNLSERSKERQTAADGGLVPCQNHAELILKGKINIKDLILSTRQHPKAFQAESRNQKKTQTKLF